VSSHHFVKEDQEPALLILDARAISFEKVQELLEWSPTVIVSESVLDEVAGWGIKVDVVVCTPAGLEPLAKSLVDQAPLKFLSCNQSEEFLSTVLYYSIAAKYKAIHVLLSDQNLFEDIQKITGIDVEVFCEDKKWSFVRSGRFKKWVAKGIQFFTFPLFSDNIFQTQGLDSQLHSLQDGKIRIERGEPFWVAEAL